jgi:ubiquinone/menaquinone biosynthesis C-methylase UbiE
MRRYADFCDRLALRRLLPLNRRYAGNGKIADVCGGFGRLAGEYLGGYKEAYLFDYAPNLLNQAKAVYGDRLNVVQGSVFKMPFASGEFDALIFIRAAHFFNDLNAAVAELSRILKNGGTAVVEIANKRNLPEIFRRLRGRSPLHPFSVEPECNNKAGVFYWFHPRHVEQIFYKNGLRVKKVLAVSGLRLYISNNFLEALLYALELFLQYTFGRLKWSPSLYYLLGKGAAG